jgi:hypothetical protein
MNDHVTQIFSAFGFGKKTRPSRVQKKNTSMLGESIDIALTDYIKLAFGVWARGQEFETARVTNVHGCETVAIHIVLGDT